MTRMRDLLAVSCVLAAIAVSGCEPSGSSPGASITRQTGSPEPASGISGVAVAGPQCPIEAAGQPCPPRPVSARIVVRDLAGHEIVTFTSDDQGRFAVALPPGEYLLESDDDQWLLVQPSHITVTAGRASELHLVLDTGIR